MASPNTLARNASLAHLKVTEQLVTPAVRGRRTAPGEYKELLKMAGRVRRQHRARERAGRGGAAREIPTSGPGRRRAKAHLRQGLCMARLDAALCREQAEQDRYCPRHAPAETAAQ